MEKLYTVRLGADCGSDDKESACNAGDPGSIPGLGRSPGEGNGYSPWGCKESDTTEELTLSLSLHYSYIYYTFYKEDLLFLKLGINDRKIEMGFGRRIIMLSILQQL